MKHVLVTGASTGIGLDIVKSLLKKNYFVWAGVRKPEVLAGLHAEYSKTLRVLKMDVTKSSDIRDAFLEISSAQSKHAMTEFSLINNAGIAIGGPCEGVPMSEWRGLFDVNVFGLIETTQVFLPLLRQTKGRVINIGSISGRIASPFLAPYATSKFAVRAFSDSLRREMRPHGVRVVLIEPGAIDTGIWDKSVDKSEDLKKNLAPEILNVYGRAIDSLVRGVKKVASDAAPVEWVTSAVLDAMTKQDPNPKYLVGKMIRVQAILANFLPSRQLDQLLAKGYRFTNGGD
jgi:NAD(P)-dependent dehydrogenase (short-subunit alcohol dehydrogenase family)